MTKPRFYADLAGVQIEGGRWFGDANASIRFHRIGKDSRESFCPITALCYAKTGQFIDTANFGRAAELLGLSQKDACDIGSAADDVNTPWQNDRRALMEACGLKETR